MPEVGLQGTRVVSLVGERVAAGVPEHVRVGLEGKPRLGTCALDHAGEASGGERRAALRCEHEGGLGLLLALEPPQGPQLVSQDRMRARACLA